VATFLAPLYVSARDIQDLSTVQGVLSWMFGIQAGDIRLAAVSLGVIVIVVSAVIIVGSIFWIRMLSDALNRKFEDENDKIAWVLVITLTHGVGAMLYYRLVKAKTGPGMVPNAKSPPPRPNG
jgi:hypothetical protein